MAEYKICWTYCTGYVEFTGATNIVAPSVEDAERIFVNTRNMVNHADGIYIGYALKDIVRVGMRR